MSESVILCEGFHDRAFWKGWLLCLGCTDPGAPQPGQTRRRTVSDPWKDPVTGGDYAYHSTGGQFVRVRPCHGKGKVLPVAELRLGQRSSKRLMQLVINVDPDVSTSGGSGGSTGLRRQDVERWVRSKIDPSPTVHPDGSIEIDGGATKVILVRWEAPDPPTPGLPDQQALERLVSAALLAAYPRRGKAVQDWLDARPDPPPTDPKEHAWSYMAGWYAEHGCDDFYTHLWRDQAVVQQLESRLRSSGAWQIAETLAGGPTGP
jgi:hypothetical protein